MDIKHVIFERGKKYLFLYISSTNIDSLVPLLYSASKPAAQEVFRLLSQPLPNPRFNRFIISETFAPQL
jgi:hypothetical protein